MSTRLENTRIDHDSNGLASVLAQESQNQRAGTYHGGAAVDPKGVVANQQQVWRFSIIDLQTLGETDFDAVYMPRKDYFLGTCDTHDILANVSFRGQYQRQPVTHSY